MNFMPVAWQIRRARLALEQWNAENPDHQYAWEWVEEMLLAWKAWKELSHTDPKGSLEHYQRYQEFAGKLPPRMVTDIFPQVRDGA